MALFVSCSSDTHFRLLCQPTDKPIMCTCFIGLSQINFLKRYIRTYVFNNISCIVCTDLEFEHLLDEDANMCFVFIWDILRLQAEAESMCGDGRFGFRGTLARFTSKTQMDMVSDLNMNVRL